MPYVASALTLVLGEASGWDKTSAIAGVIAAVTGIVIVFGSGFVWARNWWPRFRRQHTFTFDAPGYVEVGQHLALRFVIYVHRDTFLIDIGCHFRFKRSPGTHPSDGVVHSWFDKKPQRRIVRRGEAIPLVWNVEAKQPWQGYLCVEITDGSGYSCTSIAPFEVKDAPQ